MLAAGVDDTDGVDGGVPKDNHKRKESNGYCKGDKS